MKRQLPAIRLITLLPLLALYACAPKTGLALKDESIPGWMQENKVPTVGICWIEQAKIQQVKMFGDIEYHSPAPLNTLFNLASLTKPLISTTTLKLVAEGKWQLDEPLYHYWTDPDVADDTFSKKLTTRQVLAHQSGLPNWRGNEPNGKLSFAFAPGSDWKYSCEGFEYLRQALEHKFHVPIERLVDSILFWPLGMKNTRFYWDTTMDTTLYAERHGADGSLYDKEKWYTANAANLVLSTVEDYGKFGVAILKGRYLSAEMQAEMTKTQAYLKNGKEFGLSWNIIRNVAPNGSYALTHTGRNRGQNTVIILLPREKSGIVVFTNGENGDQVYKKIISAYFPHGEEIVARMK